MVSFIFSQIAENEVSNYCYLLLAAQDIKMIFRIFLFSLLLKRLIELQHLFLRWIWRSAAYAENAGKYASSRPL